jgi:predicted Rossmann-fold nucleotide-binding protein
LRPLRVLICGGRNFNNKDLVVQTLNALADEFELWAPPDKYGNTLPLGLTIITGGASGADRLAAEYAAINWTGYREFPANWVKHGRAAGPIRNQQMLDKGKPDIVVAFPGGIGTADMTRRAMLAKVPVRKINARTPTKY